MGHTVEDIYKEIELEDNEIKFSADKRRLSIEQVLQEMEQVNLTEILNETDGVKITLEEALKKHKQIVYQSNCKIN